MVSARFVMNLPKHLFMIAGTALRTLVTTMGSVAPLVGQREVAKEGEISLFRHSLYYE